LTIEGRLAVGEGDLEGELIGEEGEAAGKVGHEQCRLYIEQDGL